MGRLKGSKNKPKIIQGQEKAIPLDNREIKRQIRLLRKLKKEAPKKSPERHEINAKIRDLKKDIIPIYNAVTPEKEALIEEIIVRRPEYRRLNMNLRKFSIAELQKHLKYIEGKPNLI